MQPPLQNNRNSSTFFNLDSILARIFLLLSFEFTILNLLVFVTFFSPIIFPFRRWEVKQISIFDLLFICWHFWNLKKMDRKPHFLTFFCKMKNLLIDGTFIMNGAGMSSNLKKNIFWFFSIDITVWLNLQTLNKNGY